MLLNDLNQIRELVFYRDYFDNFFKKQNPKVRDKIDYVLIKLTHEERISEKFFKHIEGTKGLYEIRVEVGNNIFRIFCCFDRGRIIVLFNGFHKKTQKTPKNEIEFALKLMTEYFNQKEQDYE